MTSEEIRERRMQYAIERMQGFEEEEEMEIPGFEETKGTDDDNDDDDDHTVSYDDIHLSIYDNMDYYDHYFISDKDTVVPEYDDYSFDNSYISSFEENLELDQDIDINIDYEVVYEFEREIEALMVEVDRRNNYQYNLYCNLL